MLDSRSSFLRKDTHLDGLAMSNPSVVRGMLSALFAAIALLALSAPCRAELLTFREGDGNGYLGTQDTYLASSTPNTIHGADTFTSILGPGIRESHALLQFDDVFGVSSTQIPLGSLINTATLRLSTRFTTANTVFMHEMLINWSQDVATWNSLGAGIQTNDIEAKQAIAASFTAPGGFVDIDVTSSLQNWSEGETNLGWALLITAANTDAYGFQTSENGSFGLRPLLTVDFSPVPEPGSFAIVALLFSCAAGYAGTSTRQRLRRRNS